MGMKIHWKIETVKYFIVTKTHGFYYHFNIHIIIIQFIIYITKHISTISELRLGFRAAYVCMLKILFSKMYIES
jgi:hypothetical protein